MTLIDPSAAFERACPVRDGRVTLEFFVHHGPQSDRKMIFVGLLVDADELRQSLSINDTKRMATEQAEREIAP